MSRIRRTTQAPASTLLHRYALPSAAPPAPPPSRGTAPAGHARRVNITLPELQHDELLARGANVSGVIRTLLDDYLAGNVIALRVSPELKTFYDHVARSVGASDEEIAGAFVHALQSIVERRLAELGALRDELKKAVR